MLIRKPARLHAAVPAAVLAVALTACGSDDPGEQEDAAGSSSYVLGETSGPASYEDGAARADLEITLDQVGTGENADLEGTGLPAGDTEGMKPVYVHMTFTHAGGDTLEHADPLLEADVTDTKDGVGTFIVGSSSLEGLPGGCEEGSGESIDLSEDASASQCRTWLIPQDTDPAAVIWEAADGSQFTWTVG